MKDGNDQAQNPWSMDSFKITFQTLQALWPYFRHFFSNNAWRRLQPAIVRPQIFAEF